MTEAMLARHDRCIILDAHSFPTEALPTQLDFDAPPEIGIGTDAMHTSEELRELAAAYFRRQGLSVSVDRPFSGTMVPNAAFRKDQRVQSVMIEVRRDLYMDESTTEKSSRFRAVQNLVTDFRLVLIEWSER
jgi:N-formylglutamate deformylase